MKRWLSCIGGFVMIAALFAKPQAVISGITEGGRLCTQILLPSLFPFMIAVSFLSLSGGLSPPAKLLLPVFKLLHLPNQLCDIWLASFLGGYPTGAHTLAVLTQQGLLSKQAAGQMLRCCINPGPAFLILAVGQSMLGSRQIGVLLLISQVISSLALCTLLCRAKTSKSSPKVKKRLDSLSDAFVTAVTGSSSAMLNILAFVLTFSVLLSLLGTFSPVLKQMGAVLEVTLGCSIAAEIGGKTGLLLMAFFIGFGGVSVCFQVLALARQADITAKGFWWARLLSGLLNAITFRFLLIFDKTAVATIAQNTPPMAIWSADRLLGALCLAAMLLVSLKKFEHSVSKF